MADKAMMQVSEVRRLIGSVIVVKMAHYLQPKRLTFSFVSHDMAQLILLPYNDDEMIFARAEGRVLILGDCFPPEF